MQKSISYVLFSPKCFKKTPKNFNHIDTTKKILPGAIQYFIYNRNESKKSQKILSEGAL